jgi:hypothetical protein
MYDAVGLADVGEKLVAEPFTPRAPATNPAISTNSTAAGVTFSGPSMLAIRARRESGKGTTPTLGSTVQNG